jgi:multisubunit Na+/H+ antiporter MnhE subunit
MTRVVVSAALLTALYALALGSADPWDIGLGAVLGLALTTAARPLIFAGPGRPLRTLPESAWAVLALAGIVVRDIVTGTWQVARVVLHLRPLESPGIVAVPLGERTRRGTAVSGLLLSIAPGEYLVDVDWERRVMLVHVIDASDPDEIRERMRRNYERYQRKVFP